MTFKVVAVISEFPAAVIAIVAGHFGLPFCGSKPTMDLRSALRLTSRADLAPSSVPADGGACSCAHLLPIKVESRDRPQISCGYVGGFPIRLYGPNFTPLGESLHRGVNGGQNVLVLFDRKSNRNKIIPNFPRGLRRPRAMQDVPAAVRELQGNFGPRTVSPQQTLNGSDGFGQLHQSFVDGFPLGNKVSEFLLCRPERFSVVPFLHAEVVPKV